MGREVTIVAPDDGHELARAEHEGAAYEVIRLPARRIFFDPEDRLLRASALRTMLPRMTRGIGM